MYTEKYANIKNKTVHTEIGIPGINCVLFSEFVQYFRLKGLYNYVKPSNMISWQKIPAALIVYNIRKLLILLLGVYDYYSYFHVCVNKKHVYNASLWSIPLKEIVTYCRICKQSQTFDESIKHDRAWSMYKTNEIRSFCQEGGLKGTYVYFIRGRSLLGLRAVHSQENSNLKHLLKCSTTIRKLYGNIKVTLRKGPRYIKLEKTG